MNKQSLLRDVVKDVVYQSDVVSRVPKYTLLLVPPGIEQSQARLAMILNPKAVVIVATEDTSPAGVANMAQPGLDVIIICAQSKHDVRWPRFSLDFLSCAHSVYTMVGGALVTLKNPQ